MPEPYQLKVAGPAARSLEKVPERVATAVVEFMTGRLMENPHRIGKPLTGRFAGLHAARVQDYGSGIASTRTAAPSWSFMSALVRTRTARSNKIA